MQKVIEFNLVNFKLNKTFLDIMELEIDVNSYLIIVYNILCTGIIYS